MSKEQAIQTQAYQFRALAELTWTKNTIYHRDRDRFRVFSSVGQCGVTNFGFGIWLAWRGLVQPDRLLYAGGSVHAADGTLIDDKHAWLLRSKAYSREQAHIDLVLDQYANVGQRVVAATVGKIARPSIAAGYRVRVDDDQRPRQSSTVTYVPHRLTPCAEYDTARFDGRLEAFLGSCYDSTRFMGQEAVRSAVQDLWLPPNSAMVPEDRRHVIATQPCGAKQWSSILP